MFGQEKADTTPLLWAKQLYKAVNKIKPVRFQYVHTWKMPLARLLREKGIALVQSVLDWYCEHCEDDFAPQAYNGESFRRKFDQIQKVMSAAPDCPISADSKGMADRLLQEYNFPVEIAAILPAIIQRTKENWLEFTGKVVTYMALHEGSREWVFLSTMFNVHAPVFVENWLIFLSRRFGRWDHYEGSTQKLTFRIKSEWFLDHFWHRWSMDWCGSPVQFDSLLQELQK